MGFRKPITTATAVDTRPTPAAAGVRLYESQAAPGVYQGIADWGTGKMSRDATVTLTGGGSGGSSFLIDGGNAGVGPDAPTLGLNIESVAGGGYGAVLRLTAGAGGQVIADNWLKPVVGPSTFPGAANVIAYSAATNTWGIPRYAKLASGKVVLTGLLGYTGAALANGTTLGTLPAGCRPARTLTGVALGGNNRLWRWQLTPAGVLIFQLPASSDWSFVVGDNQGFLSLDGIAFMAADVNPV